MAALFESSARAGSTIEADTLGGLLERLARPVSGQPPAIGAAGRSAAWGLLERLTTRVSMEAASIPSRGRATPRTHSAGSPDHRRGGPYG